MPDLSSLFTAQNIAVFLAIVAAVLGVIMVKRDR